MRGNFYLTAVFFFTALSTELAVQTQSTCGQAIETSKTTPSATPMRWRTYVEKCLDTLTEHGTDRYGSQKTPLLMAVLDVNSLESPQNPQLFDSLVRLEDRLHRRGERGSNLWYDQATLRSMYRISKLTGQEKYAQAADAYIAHALQHCYKADDATTVYRNGMPAWGSHVYWDCYEEQPAGDQSGSGPHEILVYRPSWADMYRVDPSAVQRIVDGIWQWHIVNKATGQHNRHDDARHGCDFSFSGSSFAHAFASMYRETSENRYLERAKTVVDWHWNNRDPKTGLVADAPSLTNRYDGKHCFTTITGPHAAQLLRCYELTAERHFFDVAVAYIKAYDKYGWDPQVGSYFAMLQLDGKPVPDQLKGKGYDAWTPYGHINVWRTSIFSYEFALCAAQTSIYAYELSSLEQDTKDKSLLKIALRWAEVIEKNLPVRPSRRWKTELEEALPKVLETSGTYAEDYGRAISFFVHLHRATGDDNFLKRAETFAEEAVSKLYQNGLFKGHPAKPYYEATNGVGLLLYALLELDAPDEELEGAF